MNLTVLRVVATRLFPKQKNAILKQRAWIKLLNRGSDELITVSYQFEGGEKEEFHYQVTAGENSIELLLSDIESPRPLSIHCSGGEGVVASWSGVWQPARKWKIFQVKSSHYDLGYDGRIDAMQRDAANYLVQAERLCSDSDQFHAWHYHVEHLRFLRAYALENGERAFADFLKRNIESGNMTLSGNIGGPHFHWMDSEQLIRSTYPARRELKDRFGLDVTSISLVDNPSASWSSFQVFAQAGFRCLLRFAQGFRSPGNPFENGLPPIAWMVGPNGEDRILTSFHPSYSEPLFLGAAGVYGATLIETAAELLSERLEKVERGELRGDFPYDTLIVPNYMDFEPPHEDERVLLTWKDKFVYPEIHLEDAPAALESIGQRYGDVIPVLRGDTNNNSGDYTSIDPEAQGIKRQLLQRLYRAEAWHVLARMRTPSRWAGITKRFRDTYLTVAEFDEHCWPTMLAVNDQNIFNTVLSKRHAIGRAFRDTGNICEELSLELSDVPAEATLSCVVWNALAHSRTDVAVFEPIPNQIDGDLCAYDSIAEDRVPVQRLADGSCIFTPTVPAYGFTNYLLESAAAAEGRAVSELCVSESGDHLTLANRWIRLKIQCSTGAVVSMIRIDGEEELLDPASEWGFNGFVRCHAQPFSYSEVSSDLQVTKIGTSKARVSEAGSVRASVEITTVDEMLDAEIVTRLSLYAELDYLEVENAVHRMGFLHTEPKDRYRENVFIAFPFAIKNPSFAVDYAVGVLDPSRDFVASSNTDFVIANRWIDVANEAGGVTAAPVEAQTFHCGELKYNTFGQTWHRPNGHLYSYAWSNRMSGLSHQQPQEYQTTLTYRFRPHRGNWRESKAASFGWRMGSPLATMHTRIRETESESLLSLDRSNIQVTVLKVAEAPGRGTIVRLIETEGLAATMVNLTIRGIPCERVILCDLVENDLSELPSREGAVALEFGPYAIVTLRLEANAKTFETAQSPEIEIVSDSGVRLHLKHATAAHIFRSEVADEPPTAYSLVGYASGASFVDSNLKPGTRYTYRVAQATPLHQQGPPSAPVSALTRSPVTTPPAIIQEVGVVPMGEGRRWVYWAKSPESDTAFYRLYRAESSDFIAEPSRLLAEIEPQSLWFQVYVDRDQEPAGGFFYRLCPVDFCGNEQPDSLCFGRFSFKNGGIYE